MPEIVQKWMRNSGVIGKEKIVYVRLEQKGERKTKPEPEMDDFYGKTIF